MDSIFIVTVVFLPENDSHERYRDTRTWGWYGELQPAIDAVMDNVGDMFEMAYYTHAVIEEVNPGIGCATEHEHWFRATYAPYPEYEANLDTMGPRDWDPEPEIVPCDKPSSEEGVICYWG